MGDNMNIGMILNTPFPPDIRVEKEARALSNGGHNVFLLAYGKPSKSIVKFEHISVHYIQKKPLWHRPDFFYTLRNAYWEKI